MRSIGHVLLIFLGLFCVVGAGARAQTTQFAAVETSTIEARLR